MKLDWGEILEADAHLSRSRQHHGPTIPSEASPSLPWCPSSSTSTLIAVQSGQQEQATFQFSNLLQSAEMS
jgi:hypothetical protein